MRSNLALHPVPLLALLLMAPAYADDVRETRDVSPTAEVRVINTAGDIEIEGWGRAQVEVDADLGSNVKELIFEVDDDVVLIEVKVPRNSSRNVSSDLIIKVPQQASVEVSAVSADISIEDVHGRQRLETVSGDIDTGAFDSGIAAESVSGDVTVEGDGSEIRTRLKTVSGDIDIDNLAGEIEAGTVSGDIVLYGSRFEDANAQAVNGDIVFRSELYGSRRLHMETVNGGVEVNFIGDVSARFDIETFNGSIRNCFGPEPRRTNEYAPGRELKFTEGGGRGRVTIRTLNGSIRLCND